MRTVVLVGLSAFMIIASLITARGEESTWVVLATGELDSRVQHNLEQLAAHDHALIRIFSKTSHATHVSMGRGSIWIELRQEKSVESFRGTLVTKIGEASSLKPTGDLAKEGYIIEATYPGASAPNRLRITAATPQGFQHALLRVPALLTISPSNLSEDLIPHPQLVRVERHGSSVSIVDFPSITERGVVEGFYEAPWTHQDRVDMLNFEGAHGMNVYFYAPKDDPYHRKLWREAYPPEQMKLLGELVNTAKRNFVDFCYAISPGLSMEYSNEQDFRILTDKLASIGNLGVSCFALFLDDVQQDLQNPQDKAQFETLAAAHVYLTNKLYKYLKELSAENRLTLTPTTYTNDWGSREYIRELGAGIDPGVTIAWTGPQVVSPPITVDQAREWGGFIHRKPVVWYNYPVNDDTPWCRYLGPLTGLDPQLPSVVSGLFSNPMTQAHASMIPLQTIADYLWNAAAYKPAESATHAVVSQYGDDAPRQLAPFLTVYGTYYDEGIFAPLFRERHQPMDVAKMQSDLAELSSALERLATERRFDQLLEEISPAVKRTGERLTEVKADPAFQHLPDGQLQWDKNYDALAAYLVQQPPKLDGDFSKWQKSSQYKIEDSTQLTAGAKLWRGPEDLSARVALEWDENYLYVGVEVTDPDLYQPFNGRGIQNGDTVELLLETGFRKNFLAKEPTGDEYALYFSPGNFSDVPPSVFSDEDYLPLRAHPHNYAAEIVTAWKKTADGYSGDIAIPKTYFEGGTLAAGYEVGLAFSITKVIRPIQPTDQGDIERITLQSKKDPLFRVRPEDIVSPGWSPATFPRVVLMERKP
jgi:hypothetical protein